MTPSQEPPDASLVYPAGPPPQVVGTGGAARLSASLAILADPAAQYSSTGQVLVQSPTGPGALSTSPQQAPRPRSRPCCSW